MGRPGLNLEGAQHFRCQEDDDDDDDNDNDGDDDDDDDHPCQDEPQQSVKWSGSPGLGQLKEVSTSSAKMFVVFIQHR